MTRLEDLKRSILDRVDIVGVVSEHVSLKRSGRRWLGLCPFHAEKTPSFTVSEERGSFKCFGCGKGGDVFSFVQLRENVDFVEALRILADRVGLEFDGVRHASPGSHGRAELAKVNAWAQRFFRARLLDAKLGRAARDYLAQRAVSAEASERFALGLACDGPQSLRRAAASAGFSESLLVAADLLRNGDQGDAYETFRDRLIFPIRDATQRVVGFGGRTLVDDRAKYLNTRQTPLFDKGRGLFGIELAREAITQRGRAVVVEGYMDCLAAHQAGFGEVVATLGTALTEAQVDLLRRYTEEIVLLFDSDNAGEAAAERAIHVALPRCVRVKLARFSDGKDPSDFLAERGSEAFSDVLNASFDALEFKWLRTRERFSGGGSEAGQREAVLEFLRIVGDAAAAGAVDAIRRGQLVLQVAHLLRMGAHDVEQLMFRPRRRRGAGPPQTGEDGDKSRSTEPPSGEQAAWTRWLEIALNHPSLLADDALVPDIARIADPRDRRIASILLTLWRKEGAASPVEVSIRCDSQEDAERAVELAGHGAVLDDMPRWMEAVVRRIRRAVENEDMDRQRDACMGVEATDRPPEALLAAVGRGASRHRSFAPRRLIRHQG